MERKRIQVKRERENERETEALGLAMWPICFCSKDDDWSDGNIREGDASNPWGPIQPWPSQSFIDCRPQLLPLCCVILLSITPFVVLSWEVFSRSYTSLFSWSGVFLSFFWVDFPSFCPKLKHGVSMSHMSDVFLSNVSNHLLMCRILATTGHSLDITGSDRLHQWWWHQWLKWALFRPGASCVAYAQKTLR